MILIVCVDDNLGMMFNQRRQSQDRVLRKYILKLTENRKLWMNHYSAKLFSDSIPQINVDDDFLDKAAQGEFCFVEDQSVLQYAQLIEKVILCKWNRNYPHDLVFDLPMQDWNCKTLDEFPGSSHEKITVEEWSR